MKVLTLCTLLLVLGTAQLRGDGRKKKKDADRGAWNPYACCHKMDEIEHRPVLLIENYLAPDFFFYDTLMHGDTSFYYQCFDSRDSTLLVDTLHDFTHVRFISLYRCFFDLIHTYKNEHGAEKPLPIAMIIKRFDRTGDDKWMTITYPGNKFSQIKEYKNLITKSDTVMAEDTSTNTVIMSVYKYYKVK